MTERDEGRYRVGDIVRVVKGGDAGLTGPVVRADYSKRVPLLVQLSKPANIPTAYSDEWVEMVSPVVAPGDGTTLAEYGGLSHECTDPDCHVPGFIKTLAIKDADERSRLEGMVDRMAGKLVDQEDIYRTLAEKVQALADELVLNDPTEDSWDKGWNAARRQVANRLAALLAGEPSDG